MISEKTFALSHASFWQELLPNCERFVRRMNLAVERFQEPIDSLSPIPMRGVVNELGMRLVAAAQEEGITCEDISPSRLDQCMNEAVDFIRRFRVGSRSEVDYLSPEGVEEAKRLATWLHEFFARYADSTLQMYPPLAGFGWLDECNCDARTNASLFEVKSGDRAFRGTDIRQVMAYLALNHLSAGKTIQTMFLVNARRAVFFRIGVDALSQEISGCGIVELYHGIETFLLEPIMHRPSR